MHFTTLDEIGEDNDAALFRFISVGDTAYIMQNKATGLFISCAAANNNNVTLGLNPTLFKIGVTGKGGGYARLRSRRRRPHRSPCPERQPPSGNLG